MLCRYGPYMVRDGKSALEAHSATLRQTADVTHALSEIVEAEAMPNSPYGPIPIDACWPVAYGVEACDSLWPIALSHAGLWPVIVGGVFGLVTRDHFPLLPAPFCFRITCRT